MPGPGPSAPTPSPGAPRPDGSPGAAPSPGGPSAPGQTPPGGQQPGTKKTPKNKDKVFPVPYGQIKWVFCWPKPKQVITGAKIVKNKNPFDLVPEMARARENYSPVIFYVYTSDKKNYLAKACHKLNMTVFSDQKVVDLSKKFLCLATDFIHMHKTVRIKFKIRVVPTVIITDSFANVLFTLRGASTTPAAFKRFMETARKRNEKAVNKYKARMETLQAEFQKADQLLDEGKFDKATKILDRMAKNKLDRDLAEGAKARLDEMKMGLIFIEGVKALEEKNFDLAKVKLLAVADSQISNRWSSRAWEISKSIPAAKLFHQAMADLKAKNNYEAMQKLQKITTMEDAGFYRQKAQDKIEEIKKNWRKRVK